MSVMAQLNQFHSFHQSSLPNGKIDWEWIEIEEQWAPREQSNEWNELLFLRSTRNLSWVFFGLALFSLCGLRAAAAALLRKEEKTRADKPKGANSMKGEEWEWNEAEMECERIVELFWWNDNEIKRMKQTRQWNGGWMEPNPRSQKLRGKPTTHFTFLSLWRRKVDELEEGGRWVCELGG